VRLNLPNSINNFFKRVFPFVFVINSYHNIFEGWELQNFTFNEVEDFGTLFFVLGISACESALITVFLWWIIHFWKKGLSKPDSE
jgi:hypothetical protein